MTQLKNLFKPVTIGSMELKNRIVMAPMTLDYANDDETPSDRQIAYYAERARGGVGLITMEVVTVDGDHRYQQHSLGLYNDELIPHHKKLVDAVHAEGAKIVPQLSHTGPESLGGFYSGTQPVGPSVVRTPTTMQVCRELETEEIAHYVSLYGDAALRAKKAGYDGVELHSAHSYMLLGSFLSPLRNFRTDEYGGKLEGRMKLLLEVLADIRSKVGDDFPIQVRVSGYERESGGREINETVRMAPALVEAGVDAFHISGGVSDGNITQIICGSEYPAGYNVTAAAALKAVVDVPVMVVGRNMDPQACEAILRNDMADMVVVGRSLLVDPEWPKKAFEGNVESIRPCNSCEDCVDTIMKGGGSACALNAETGRETEIPLREKAEQSKKVVVVGGGVAGMEAARIAADRGHEVTLLEKSARLGGNFNLAARLLEDHQPYLDWLISQVQNSSVDVRLGAEATEELIKELSPHVLLLATGGQLMIPELPGMDCDNVFVGKAVHELIENDFAGVSQDVVVLGGNVVATEIADHLGRSYKNVTLINYKDHRIADGAGKKRRGEVSRRLDMHGVKVLTGVQVSDITGHAVKIIGLDGKARTISAGSVIVADEMVADGGVLECFQSLAPAVHVLGDCAGPGLVKKAVQDAALVAYGL